MRRRHRRDPASRAHVIQELYEETDQALDDRRMGAAREVGAVLADALESHGYQTLGERVSEAVQSGQGYRWDSIDYEIRQAIRQIASGRESELQNEFLSVGYAPSHREGPYHSILKAAGYDYSHSTRVFSPGPGQIETTLHHTYFKLGRPRPISVAGSDWATSSLAFAGRDNVTGRSLAQLTKYLAPDLRRKQRRS